MPQGRLNSSPVYSLNGLGASRKIFCIKPLLLLPPCGEIRQTAPLAATKFICSLGFISYQCIWRDLEATTFFIMAGVKVFVLPSQRNDTESSAMFQVTASVMEFPK